MGESESGPQPASTPATDTNSGELAAWSLDVKKLHSLPSDQQDLYLLNFTTDLVHHVESLDPDSVSAEQASLKHELLQIVNLSAPAPSRVIRNNIGRIFGAVFQKGNRKLLYESINDLAAVVNAGKEKDLRAKHAATHCLGAVFEAAGDSAVSLSPLACTSLLKLLKTASNETGLRSAIFRSLGKIITGIVAAIDEDVGRVIWKQARNAASGDKSALVQASACGCLEQLVSHTTYFDNSNDFEKLQTAIYKSMDNPSVLVRQAATSCLSSALVKSYSETPNKDALPRIKKPKKPRKAMPADEGEDEIERTSSPVPEKPATALSYSLADILRLLSANYMRPSTSNRARAAVANCYIRVLRALGESVVEQRYGDIVKHFVHEFLGHATLQFHKYRQLISRKFVRIILEKVVGRMLGETAQLNACRFLLNDILKDYPQAAKERPEPSRQALAATVSALTSLLQSLDAGVAPVAELCRESLLQVLQHPNFTVQIITARALRAFVLACPQQLLPSVTICLNSVIRELGFLGGQRQSPRRCVGYAHGLAAILSTSNAHPLYGSVDVYARVLSQATDLLKSSGTSDLRISSCQLQVAWIMIGGLMSLGPSFVKIHLQQLMLLWRNALPKPVGKEHMSQRNMLELSYLANVRECALGSIKAFLTYNQRLLTSDISRRLTGMLENTVSFLQLIPDKRTSDEPTNRLSPALQLQDYEVMVRRRVFQCFSMLLTLSPLGAIESTAHSTILPLAVASFSDAEYYAPGSLSAAIASAAGTFETIWEVGDNYGFGVTSLTSGLNVRDPISRKTVRHWTALDDEESEIDRTIMSPICAAPEHDPTCCYLDADVDLDNLPDPAGTETVNAAIAAFALSLPLQAPKVQESMLEQMASSLVSPALQKDPARRAAITINISLALQAALRVGTGDAGVSKGSFQSSQAEKAMQSLLHSFLKDSDPSTRLLAADALGRLCSSSGNALTTAEVTYLMETIVNNREPYVRAGCAMALANIHSQLGGMAAGFHMKNIVGILMSLAADTHPLVHFWAIDSLGLVAESAGLNFSGYVTGTLGLLSRLYVSDGHNDETTALAASNMAVELLVPAAVARGVDSLINVLGPDLQDMAKTRDMILTLVGLFSRERCTRVLLASLSGFDHLSLYAPGHVDFKSYVKRLQSDLDAAQPAIAAAAVDGLFHLMRRDASEIVRTATPGLEERLWEFLNDRPDTIAIRKIFLNWLQQTGPTDPAGWIARCNTILTKAQAKAEKPKTAELNSIGGPDLQDDEVAGFAAAGGVSKEDDKAAPSSTQELMRWQVRLFAMECLHSLIAMISKEAAITEESAGEAALQQKIADVVRIAFSASTAGVAALRIVGLRIVEQILQLFGRTPDPDFSEAMLLEQYQAQISSALTPAFAADSSPELAAEAVNVCATFISTGIVRDVERMGRILKLLVSALASFSDTTEAATIGDLKGLSSNAQVMVRMAVFTAWADLQVASGEQTYLDDVVKPHIAQLVPLWLTSLREYARLRFEPDISATTATIPGSEDLDTVYAAFNRQALLKFYQESWLSLVDAIASLIDEDSSFVFDALDGKRPEATNGTGNDEDIKNVARRVSGINYREEPVAFFFVLFGLAFESLAVRTNDDDLVTQQRNMDILRALNKILRPSVSGNAIYQEVVFAESMDLMDRMVLTGSLGVQAIIVEIARNLCLAHPSSRQGMQAPANGEMLSDDIEQLFELTRTITLVLAGLVPKLGENPVSTRLETSDEAVNLVGVALQALVDVSEVFPNIIKTDLHASILHIFVTIFGTGACQAAVVPQALPIFRRFVSSITENVQPDTPSQLQSTLSRMLAILKNAQKRETEASLACEKNILLACTVLISGTPKVFDTNSMLTKRFTSGIGECLESQMTSRVAAGCFRTLVLAGIGQRELIGRAVSFITEATELEGLNESKTIVSQTLTTYIARFSAERKAPIIAMCMHAFLQRAIVEGTQVHQETAGRLLELANADNATFRAIVAGMTDHEKSILEQILRARAGTRTEQGFSDDREPTIALKMKFGG